MPANTPPTAAALRKAADLRAAGTPWDAVGAAVGCSGATARKWPLKYPARWRSALRAAERRTLLDATAEAILVLRTHLRADDEKTVREAAAKLVQIRVALDRGRKPSAKQPAGTDPPGYADRLVRHARSLTRDQLRELRDLVDGESGDEGAA
jgi:hypothetical protein